MVSLNDVQKGKRHIHYFCLWNSAKASDNGEKEIIATKENVLGWCKGEKEGVKGQRVK